MMSCVDSLSARTMIVGSVHPLQSFLQLNRLSICLKLSCQSDATSVHLTGWIDVSCMGPLAEPFAFG